jgi:hypothetical protein
MRLSFVAAIVLSLVFYVLSLSHSLATAFLFFVLTVVASFAAAGYELAQKDSRRSRLKLVK